MPSPRFGTGLFRSDFDWPRFLGRLYLQPALIWLALSHLTLYAAHWAPRLLGASCSGPERNAVVNAAFFLYACLVPGGGTALYYLLFARRRLEHRPHRLTADLFFALIMAVSLFMLSFGAYTLARKWSLIAPGLGALQRACWP